VAFPFALRLASIRARSLLACRSSDTTESPSDPAGWFPVAGHHGRSCRFEG